MTSFIAKDTVKRLIKDVKQLIQSPLCEQGIYYKHDESNMLKGYAMIIGPTSTPYFGGYYFFEFNYPPDYPYTPPKVTYHTNANNIRFNPNLYCNGKVCVSLLNTWKGDQWTSCQTISTVLLTLCTLFTEIPLLNEPGVTIDHPDVHNYTEIINYCNIDIAICDIICKKIGVYQPFFDLFYPQVKELFYKNYDILIDFIKNKLSEPVTLSACYYNMNIYIDYKMVETKLQQSKHYLDNL